MILRILLSIPFSAQLFSLKQMDTVDRNPATSCECNCPSDLECNGQYNVNNIIAALYFGLVGHFTPVDEGDMALLLDLICICAQQLLLKIHDFVLV